MDHPDLPKPTEAELEILQVLWQRGPCTVREVNDVLNQQPRPKEMGYTTTLKLMQIMHEKGLLARDENARTHVYQAVAPETDTQGQLLDRFVNTVFKGSALKLVMQALGKQRTSADELKEIRRFIDDMEKGGGQ
ncbi:MAG: BlaI/MecI/CopY family transcriptional regulator [Bernardetiaceae bacterium]|jgi:predicted transcriptional regulator|nr:BlaI/MecI/CopY family transcriptional regulator [Bernardetiaceae bacterium]